jgi:hypothetical protein
MGEVALRRMGIDFNPITNAALGPDLQRLFPNGLPTVEEFPGMMTPDNLFPFVEGLTNTNTTVWANDPTAEPGHVYGVSSKSVHLDQRGIDLLVGLGPNVMRSLWNSVGLGYSEVPPERVESLQKEYQASVDAYLPKSLLNEPSNSLNAFQQRKLIEGLAILGRYSLIEQSGSAQLSKSGLLIFKDTAFATAQHPLSGYADHGLALNTGTGELRQFVVGRGQGPCPSIDLANNVMQAPLWDARFRVFAASIANYDELASQFGEHFLLQMKDPNVREAVLSKLTPGERRVIEFLRMLDYASGVGVIVKQVDPFSRPSAQQVQTDDAALGAVEEAGTPLPILDQEETVELVVDGKQLAASSPDAGTGIPVSPNGTGDPVHSTSSSTSSTTSETERLAEQEREAEEERRREEEKRLEEAEKLREEQQHEGETGHPPQVHLQGRLG